MGLVICVVGLVGGFIEFALGLRLLRFGNGLIWFVLIWGLMVCSLVFTVPLDDVLRSLSWIVWILVLFVICFMFGLLLV